MTILKICGVALIAAFSVCVMKIYKPELVLPVCIAGALALMSSCVELIDPIAEYVNELSDYNGASVYVSSVMKALGISIISESTAAVCRDSGAGAIASKVELSAKIMIILIALPIMKEILRAVSEVMK